MGKERKIDDAWTTTVTHRRFNVFNPCPDDVDIKDIAHALACCARFNGHLIRPLSVAEHCYFVSRFVSSRNRFVALLHDASEAYLSDIPRPIKRHLPEFQRVEQRVTKCILKKYGLDPKIPGEVHLIDRRMCASEAFSSGFDTHHWEDSDKFEPLNHVPRYWHWTTARDNFITRFKELSHEHNNKLTSGS